MLDGRDMVEAGDLFQTYEFLDLTVYTDLTKTLDTPIYNPIISQTTYTSTGPGDDKTITLDPDTTFILVYKIQGATVSLYNTVKDAANKLQDVDAASYWSWECNKRMRQMIIAFAAAGSCVVIEAKETIS